LFLNQHKLFFFFSLTQVIWKGLTRALNFERPCYLRGGICLKRGSPNCEPFRGPCRAFTVCCLARFPQCSSEGVAEGRKLQEFNLYCV
uniref:Beta-defensin n=1 Tax=Sciurus vulgaris TaxID=55149 RepID=A0A8D2ATQ4_SCIVU